MIIQHYDRMSLTFIRWNGGGDLFKESVECINMIGRKRPDIVIWVTTKHPRFANKIEHFPNVYLHFSLDRDSIDRADSVRPLTDNWFFSYQCAPKEYCQPVPASVIFFDRYKPPAGAQTGLESVCPLNTLDDISGACESCRRCFDGSAVKHRKSVKW